MAITRSSFSNIPSSGVIPEKLLPASSFALSFQFSYTATPSLDTFDKTFTGKIVIQVLSALNVVKYEITIEEKYAVYIFGLSPGLALFTWNWVASYEKVSGKIGGPEGPPMTTLGEATFGVDPAEGSGTTDGPVYIDSRFYSKIFTEPLESGDRLKIKFHNLSAGYVVSRASLSLATEGSAVGEDALLDTRTGTRYHLYIDESLGNLRVVVARSRRIRNPLNQDEIHIGIVEENSRLGGLKLMRIGGGAMIAVGAIRNSPHIVRVFVTTDEGDNWERVMNMDLKMNLLASCPLRQGAQILAYGIDEAQKPAYAILSFGKVTGEDGQEKNGWRAIETGTPQGPIFPTKGQVTLEPADGGAVRLLWRDETNQTFYVLVSTDGGKNYAAEATS